MSSCRIINSPITGEKINSDTWNALFKEVGNEQLADKLYAQLNSEAFKNWYGDWTLGEKDLASKVTTLDGEPLLVFHSSIKNFREFDNKYSQEVGFHFGTEQSAVERHSPWAIDEEENYGKEDINVILKDARTALKGEIDDFTVYPVFLNIRNMIEGVDYLDAEHNEEMTQDEYDFLYKKGRKAFKDEMIKLVIAFHQKGTISRDQALQIFDKKLTLQQALNADGYWYINRLEAKGEISYVVFNENNIKSIYNNGEYSLETNDIYYNLSGEEPQSELSQSLMNFLDKLNVTVEFKDELKSATGYNALSLTDLLYKTILVRNNFKEEGLLKETAYVAYSFLGRKNKIRTDLAHSIENIDGYDIIYKNYKTKSPNLADFKIKELIIVDFIADAIKNNFEAPKDSYQNRQANYWSIKGNSKIEKQINYLLAKLKQFVVSLFTDTKLSNQEIQDIIDDIANDVIQNNFGKYNSELAEGEQLTDYERTLSTDPKAQEIVENFQKLDLILTGSLSLRKNGTLYRSIDEDLHDLDFSVASDRHGDFFQQVLQRAEKDMEGASAAGRQAIYNGVVRTLNKEYKKHPILSKIKEIYPEFKVTNSFSGKTGDITVTGKIGDYAIDLFFVDKLQLDKREKGFQDWEHIFQAKLHMGRAKDIRDFANYIPYGVTNTQLAQNKGFRHFTFGQVEDAFYSLSPNQVNYNLKIINALQKTPRKKYPSGSVEGFYNDLIKLGTPKAQLDILKQHILSNNIKEINTDDLITSLLAEISYTIEINTATDRKKAYEAVDGEIMFLKDGWKYSNLGGKYVRKKQGEDYKYITEDLDYTQFNEAYNSLPKNPTQHYSTMTVPGGTNYTENEIATPAIVPSILGHAEFSTENGIGWFRSDDKATATVSEFTPRIVMDEYGDDTQEGIIDKSEYTPTEIKTRRILEVQSDLFQKGRNNNILTNSKHLDDIYMNVDFTEEKTKRDSSEIERINEKLLKSSNNQFLQLLNKDNNWITFFVKSIIQDSAKKGYEKVLFPSGNTANKVEGQETLEEFLKEKEKRLHILNNESTAIRYNVENNEGDIIGNEVKRKEDAQKQIKELDREFKAIGNKHKVVGIDKFGDKVKDNSIEIAQLEKEIEDAKTGKNKFTAINNFYENVIHNILVKQGFSPERIVDEYDNGWIEVTITPEIAKKVDTILMNLKLQQKYDAIPLVALNTLSKNGFVSKFNPKDIVFEDRWYFNQSNGLENSQRWYHQYMSMNNLNREMFTEGISQSGIPYLIPNSSFSLYDAIEENNTKIHKDKYEAIIEFFISKFGIPRNKINYITKKEFAKKFPDKYKENAQSVYYKGNFYFFTNNLTADVTVEELLHPFIFTVKEYNKSLFDNLLAEAKKSYPKLFQKIQVLYKDQTQSIRDQELVTQALSRVFNNVYENEEPKSFLEVIKDFVGWIAQHLNEIFKQFHTGKVINLSVEQLDPRISLEQIAQLLNATDTKFDVVFPEGTFYNMGHTPKDFNETVMTLLTDKRVEAQIDKLLVKLPDALKDFKKKLTSSINKKEKQELSKVIKDMEEFEDQDKQNLIKSQLKGIITTAQIFEKLEDELKVISKDPDMDDSIKLSYYMSIYQAADGLSAFKQIMLGLRRELSELRMTQDKHISQFVYLLNKALAIEDVIKEDILHLVKTPLINILSENNEGTVNVQLEELNSKIKEIEDKIQTTTSLQEKDKLQNKLAPLLKERKSALAKAPTKENLQKVVDGVFADASKVSLIFESMIANGHPLVNTLQDMINDIYDRAGGNMVNSKNEMQTYLDEYLKAKGLSLRDMNKVYKDIGDDIVRFPSIRLKKESDEPDLDGNGNIQFDYISQYALYQETDNEYITKYLELELIKEYYLNKLREDVAKDIKDSPFIVKYRAAFKDFEDFKKENSQEEYTEEYYTFKNMLNEEIGGKTLKQITGDIYNKINELENDVQRADSTSREGAILALKVEKIKLKKLRSEYNDDGTKKDADGLRIASVLIEYNRLRYLYGDNILTEEGETKYKFDLKAIEDRKSLYTLEDYKDKLSKIQQTVISQDYFDTLSDITGSINDLTNRLIEASEDSEIAKYQDKNEVKERKRNIYEELKNITKPYRDENQVIDGITLTAQNPDLVGRIKQMQQYVEDLKFESTKLYSLSPSETNELKDLRKNKNRNEDENERMQELIDKREAFKKFKKDNLQIINELNSLFKELGDLSDTSHTEYYDKMLEAKLAEASQDEDVIESASEYVDENTEILLANGLKYIKKDGKWYERKTFKKKVIDVFIGDPSVPFDTGYNEMVGLVIDFLADIKVKETEWWEQNHYTYYAYNKKTNNYVPMERPIYIWEHQTPVNPNFVEIRPAKEYETYKVKDEYINKDYGFIYKDIPIPKGNNYRNKKYFEIIKDPTKAKFLNYLRGKYIDVQKIYPENVFMGHVRPSIIKTSGENAVNTTNKALSFDGTFTELFSTNAGETDTDTSYLLGGSQTNNKKVPMRFVGKMDIKQQTMNVVGSILLFEYHASLYKALNDKLPIFEAAQLLAAKVEVTENKNYIDKLGFFGKVRKMFSPSDDKEQQTQKKEVEKTVLSKSVDHMMNVFIYGQRIKPEVFSTPVGNVDLAKVSQNILGFAAKWLFAGNIISAMYNSLATRLQAIINSGIRSKLYTLKNLANAQAIASDPSVGRDLLSDWTKLGNKSLTGQMLDYFSFLAEDPGREITDKSEFFFTKKKMDFLTSPKAMSEFEVLFIQFLTIADNTIVKVDGKDVKLSHYKEIFEIKDGKFQKKAGVEFTEQQEKIFRGKFQGMARKLAGAYRTTEISSVETHWLGKSGFFLRRYFVAMVRNRFVGESWNRQEGELQIGYHRETFNNMIKLFKDWKNFGTKQWYRMSDKEKVAFYKTTLEYGMLFLMIGLLSLTGGDDDDKKTLKKNSWAYNMMLVTLFRAKTEMEQFTLKGVDDLIRTGKNPFMIFTTMGNVTKTIGLIYPTVMGKEKAYYQQSSDVYIPILGHIHEKGDPKLLVSFLKIYGLTGATFVPHEYLVNFRNAQNR